MVSKEGGANSIQGRKKTNDYCVLGKGAEVNIASHFQFIR